MIVCAKIVKVNSYHSKQLKSSFENFTSVLKATKNYGDRRHILYTVSNFLFLFLETLEKTVSYK
jgi:hypothetical protein